ncbi:hypothetical protein EC973_002517 [Apophysomyces ossiformis]|uniref:ER transporter 6TM N-terminal domain-containing protein n=1 Tax=Apophysomyces ossiformis TaxID=679940 RepID=A0A8H7ETR4_9FUNG|nr:hypothetical protein EC973_002517 [Apophysomyces ossiformis]
MKHLFVGKKQLWKKIIKCTIAYEIGTILVLAPNVNTHLGAVPYLVTLGTLFFNPSGTTGNQVIEMILNAILVIAAGIWCAIFSYLCTLYNRARIEWGYPLYANGAGVIAALAFFVCVFGLAYCRLRYPRFFVPALQGFTIPFFGLTKGIYGTTFNVMSIVGIVYPTFIGGAVALIVNLLLWPETAAKNAEVSLGETIRSMRNMVLLVRNELLQEDANSNTILGDLSTSNRLNALNKDLQDNVVKLRKAGSEAKYEIVVAHYSPRSPHRKAIVNLLDNLAKSMMGFSLAIEREIRIVLAQRMAESTNQPIASEELAGHVPMTAVSSVHRVEYKHITRLQSSVQTQIRHFLAACVHALNQIEVKLSDKHVISALGEPQASQTSPADYTHTVHLSDALDNLKSSYLILQEEYRQRKSTPMEEHFLVYTILYTLTEFGKELQKLEEHVNLVLEHDSRRRLYFPHVPLHKWLGRTDYKRYPAADEQVIFDEQQFLRRMESSGGNTARRPSQLMDHYHEGSEVDEEEEEEEEPPVPLQLAPGRHRWTQWLHKCSVWLQSGPVRYAIKFTVAMELLAMMAWLPVPGVNDLYNNNHGQWALLSAMVVFNFTIGATAVQSAFRVIATIIGAVFGYICLLAGHRNENPYVVAVMTLIFQIPLWYMLLGSPYPRIGFISLLTMAVITSTGYMDTFQEGIFAPVWKRTITSIFAILVVMLIDQLLWPVWARKMGRKYLGDLLIATGIQYSKVLSLVCQENTQSYRYHSTLEDALEHSKILQRQYAVTQEMLVLAASEPRLTKGPFPRDTYRRILEHEKKILYWIDHLMKAQGFINVYVRSQIMRPLNVYRKELAAAVHLYLFTLGSSLRTKSSLPASLPSAELARRTLQHHQTIIWANNYEYLCQLGTGSDMKMENAENQVYWHTYAAGSIELILEQEAMGDLVARLMGQHMFKVATKDWISS